MHALQKEKMENRMKDLAKKIREINSEREFIESQSSVSKNEYMKLMDELEAFKRAYNLTVILLNKY
jgi:NAD-dependent DNA ligase